MSEQARPRVELASAIRSSAFGLLIGGAMCLYFGFSLVPDAPLNASPEEQERWFAVDQAFNWCLRIVGAGFLLTAGLAAAGMRHSMLLATVMEALFTLLMIAMTIGWTIDARAVGASWNPQVIILLILAIFGAIGMKRSWELFAITAGHRHTAESP